MYESDSSKLTHLELPRYPAQLSPKSAFYTWTAAAVLVLHTMQNDLQGEGAAFVAKNMLLPLFQIKGTDNKYRKDV